jgi:hypothetical protein
VDLSTEAPTRASVVARVTVSEVRLAGRVRRFVRINLAGHGPSVGAAFVYLLIVIAATGAAVAFGITTRIKGDSTVAVVFVIVLVVGVWGHKRLR